MTNQLFEAALGIQSPWFVQGVDFDETCSKHGHNYLTLVTDMQARRVLFVTNSFNADTPWQDSSDRASIRLSLNAALMNEYSAIYLR